MYECYFSGEMKREKYSDYYCPDVKAIQKIVKLYGSAEIREILEQTCLRNKLQRSYKINRIIRNDEKTKLETIKEKVNEELKETVEEKNNTDEKVEKKPQTRSQKKKHQV